MNLRLRLYLNKVERKGRKRKQHRKGHRGRERTGAEWKFSPVWRKGSRRIVYRCVRI